MLHITSLTKKFGDKVAVDNVSFDIKEKEIFTLIGPNSSGKSTIIKSIAGLVEPTKGLITIDGYDVVKKPVDAKKRIGYIPDEPSVWPHMTGEEFLYFVQALFGVEEKKRLASIPSLLKHFHLNGLEKQYFEEYSRGNKQKFSITAALSHTPKLLLVDEPIVGLDPTGAVIAKKLFTEFRDAGGSVLLVTHTLTVAEEISDRIGFLKDGKLVAVGTLAELRETAGLKKTAKLEDVYNALL